MDDNHRLRRDEPERTSPIRNWSTLYRQPDSWRGAASTAPSQAAGAGPRDDASSAAVTHGVTLGYQVVEEHIRQGQRIAQQLNTRSYNVQGGGNDVRDLLERLTRDSTNLLTLWFNFISSLAGNTEFWRQPPSSQPPSPAASGGNGAPLHKTAPAEGAADHITTVTFEILAACPTQVTLNLPAQSETLPLVTPGLHALDGDKPPLKDVAFTPGLEGRPLQIRIRVPDGHPPGSYSGALVDRHTGIPHGVLSVRLIS